LASSGAGNTYICDSTINFLEETNPAPAETLILIMWSGSGRKDLAVSGDWWYHLNKTYAVGSNVGNEYYVFSGGLSNSWTKHEVTKKMFNWLYKVSDPLSLCLDSIKKFACLESYLKMRGYQYRFTNFWNCWNINVESTPVTGDYTIGYFCKDHAVYQNYDFSNWIFVNDQRDCLGEFVMDINELDNTGHPTVVGHTKFVEQIVMPRLKDLLD
jgi:hypothetical protein